MPKVQSIVSKVQLALLSISDRQLSCTLLTICSCMNNSGSLSNIN